jgi:hypothetical protein
MNTNITKMFTSDEWRALLDTPLKVGRAMMYASPSNFIGTMQESSRLAGSMKALENSTSYSPLMRTLADHIKDRIKDLKASEKTTAAPSRDPAETRNEALQASQQVSTILAKAPPADATEYKHYVLSVAQNVAEASGEEGLLGLTGKKVSDPEQALYNDLARVLGMPAKVLSARPESIAGTNPAPPEASPGGRP